MTLKLSEAALDELAKEGYDPAYGARPLKRLIQQRIANPLATELLEGRIQDGDTVRVSASALGLLLEPPGRDDPTEAARPAAQ